MVKIEIITTEFINLVKFMKYANICCILSLVEFFVM